MRARIVAVLIASTLSTAALASDTFRCGSWIISAELTVAELRGKCGEPLEKDSKTVDVRGSIASGASVARGTTTIEHWTYKTAGDARYVVTIVDGVIRGIERAL
jgi:hypothetical protein